MNNMYKQRRITELITIPLKDKLVTGFSKLSEMFYNSVRSPEGYKAPYICVWKICSKPLKKYYQAGKSSTGLGEKRLNDMVKATIYMNRF